MIDTYTIHISEDGNAKAKLSKYPAEIWSSMPELTPFSATVIAIPATGEQPIKAEIKAQSLVRIMGLGMAAIQELARKIQLERSKAATEPTE